MAKSAAEWEEEFLAVSVPAGQVLSLPDALSHPHLRGRDMIGRFDDVPEVGHVEVFRPGFKLNGEPPKVDTPPPTLSQHTDEILAEMGLSEEEISQLRNNGVV